MNVYVVTSLADLEKVWKLTYDVYAEEGYCLPNPEGLLRHYLRLDNIPETTVIVAENEGQIVGTNTFTYDGPAGLHVDYTFKSETDEIRAECKQKGLVLGDSWRIVTSKENRNRITTLLALIDLTLDLGVKNGKADICLFTFHPKHYKIYSRLLGLKAIAGPKKDCSVNSSPAILMRGDKEKMLEVWKNRSVD